MKKQYHKKSQKKFNGKKATIAEKKWQQEWQRKVKFIELEERIKDKP